MVQPKSAALPPHDAGVPLALRKRIAVVRRIALSFPQVEEGRDRFSFSVPNKGKLKGFAWVWMERVHPKQGRVPNHAVLAIRVPNLAQKEAILASDPVKFFTEPHYNGFPAVLVRLGAATVADLELLLEDGWRSQAPKELLVAFAASARKAAAANHGVSARSRGLRTAKRPTSV